jgi:hypothetical protein
VSYLSELHAAILRKLTDLRASPAGGFGLQSIATLPFHAMEEVADLSAENVVPVESGLLSFPIIEYINDAPANYGSRRTTADVTFVLAAITGRFDQAERMRFYGGLADLFSSLLLASLFNPTDEPTGWRFDPIIPIGSDFTESDSLFVCAFIFKVRVRSSCSAQS